MATPKVIDEQFSNSVLSSSTAVRIPVLNALNDQIRRDGECPGT